MVKEVFLNYTNRIYVVQGKMSDVYCKIKPVSWLVKSEYNLRDKSTVSAAGRK